MILGFAFDAGCRVLLAETTVVRETDGWREQTRLELQAAPRCGQVTVPLPPGVTLIAHEARKKRIDARSGRVAPFQWEVSGRSVNGRATATLFTPELTAGDRLIVEVTRTAPGGPLRWTPGAPAAYTSLTDGSGAVEFATNTDANFGFDLDDAAPSPAFAALLPAGDVTIERHLRLVIPDGDPQVLLYPGGGSSVEVADYFVFPAAEDARGWPLDAPADARVALVSEPEGMASLRADGVLQVQPSPVPIKVRASWTLPDAPTYGERDPGWRTLDVHVDDGVVRWEGDAWFLHQAHGRVVIPNRAALERALDARFREVAIPEPGSPMTLRGAPTDWSTAAAIRDALADKVAIAEHTTLDPLFPRRLTKSVRSGALTPVEAGLVAWLWARQQRFDADWYLVRPASRGAHGPTVLAGYDRVLVRISLDGETRWIDPTCRICAPFELPPDLEGASMLGAHTAPPPPLTPGVEQVVVQPDEVRWHLEGPAALELRAWLREIPGDQRASQLAHRLGGSGAELRSLTGADVAGATVDVVVSRGSGPYRDPLATSPALHTVWWPWVGVRELRVEGASGEAVTFERAGLTYTRTMEGETRVERLTVDRREVDVTVVTRLDTIRLSPPEPGPATP